MEYQTTFKRHEMKYILTRKQKDLCLAAIAPYMLLDRYGHSTIRNIYFDTPSYRLVRHSIEKPVYKEKLRIRSYKPAKPEDTVFVELKKKYQSVVYKRRLASTEKQVMDCFNRNISLPIHSQIADEIDYFRWYYVNLIPTAFISYEREAYYSLDGSDFRVTFDENILGREQELKLSSEIYGTPLLDSDLVLMELKTSGGIPLWMSHFLSENMLYKSSFSKYGIAYEKIILQKSEGEILYA